MEYKIIIFLAVGMILVSVGPVKAHSEVLLKLKEMEQRISKLESMSMYYFPFIVSPMKTTEHRCWATFETLLTNPYLMGQQSPIQRSRTDKNLKQVHDKRNQYLTQDTQV